MNSIAPSYEPSGYDALRYRRTRVLFVNGGGPGQGLQRGLSQLVRSSQPVSLWSMRRAPRARIASGYRLDSQSIFSQSDRLLFTALTC